MWLLASAYNIPLLQQMPCSWTELLGRGSGGPPYAPRRLQIATVATEPRIADSTFNGFAFCWHPWLMNADSQAKPRINITYTRTLVTWGEHMWLWIATAASTLPGQLKTKMVTQSNPTNTPSQNWNKSINSQTHWPHLNEESPKEPPFPQGLPDSSLASAHQITKRLRIWQARIWKPATMYIKRKPNASA